MKAKGVNMRNTNINNEILRLTLSVAAQVNRVEFARTAAAICFHCVQAKGFRGNGKFNVKQAVKRVTESTDTRFPVSVISAEDVGTLFQYKGKYLGRYFTNDAQTAATELGISENYTDKQGAVKQRVLRSYKANTNVTLFRSVAKACVDTWSEPGKTVNTTGGGVQLLLAQREGKRPAKMISELSARAVSR
jgi:hypothetical protein